MSRGMDSITCVKEDIGKVRVAALGLRGCRDVIDVIDVMGVGCWVLGGGFVGLYSETRQGLQGVKAKAIKAISLVYP